MIGNSVINDYRTGYPHPQSIVGVDWERIERLNTRYRECVETLTAECTEVESWIEGIPDSRTRRIFRMYFEEGISQMSIGRAVNLDQSAVSKIISDILKLE